MKSLSVLCLSLLLFHAPFSLARKGGGFGKGFGSRKTSTSNRGNTNSNAGNRNNAGSSSQGGYPKQPAQPNQGGYPPQSGRYPQQPGGYPNQYPARGSPYGGGGYGGQGGYAGQGGYGGVYGGGYINQNPNNRVLSPQYGGSFGYGGQGARGGSPFSHSVNAMGMRPSDRSRGFGRNAAMAAAGGAMAGMALGYGLGRFPRPPFGFHNSQEEHYYNHYMYRKYGTKSTDDDDYSRDYRYSQPSITYDSYMAACMKRTDVLPAENRKANSKPAAAATATAVVASAPGSNATESTNGTAAGNSSTAAPSTPRPLHPEPPASRFSAEDDNDNDDETVSIVEIGYPALIQQVKARRCLELYMVFSEKYLKRPTDGAQRLETGWPGFAVVVISTAVMLLNSNVLTLLH